MNNPAIINKSESGLQGMIEAMQKIPFPSDFPWDTVILVKVKNDDELCFEIIISDGKVQIKQGKPLAPVFIIEEREYEIVSYFSVADPHNIIFLLKPDGTFPGGKDSRMFEGILAITRNYIQKDSSNLLTRIKEKDKENRSLSVSGLQISQVPINPGKCPICNQSLSSDEATKTIDIYTYRLASRSELSSTTRTTWSNYSEFEAHPFEICQRCNKKKQKGFNLIVGSACSAIALFCILIIWPLAPDIVEYPIGALIVAALISLVWAYIKYGPISPEKKLAKIALSHRKQKHSDAGVFTENELKEIIKRNKLTNP